VEEGCGREFFFVRTTRQIDTVFEGIRRKFPDLFEGGGRNREATPESSRTANVVEGIEQRERLKKVVIDYMGAKYNENTLSLYEFFFWANEARRHAAQQRRQQQPERR
jgi:hypothetical protein